MKKILFIVLLFFASFAYSQQYGKAILLDSTFVNTDSVAITTVAGIDSIPGELLTGGLRTLYSGLQYVGRPEGSYAISFRADSNTIVGNVPYLQIYLRHLYLNASSNKDWGAWQKLSFRKDSEFATATTEYDSLTYDLQYFIQFKVDTYLKGWHQSNGVQFKVTTLDTFGVIPRLLHFPR